MKMTLTTSQAVDILMKDDYASWTREGATALVEWLDEIDENAELDLVAIRCQYTQYGSAEAAVWDLLGAEIEKDQAVEKLENEGILIARGKFGVIVLNQ